MATYTIARLSDTALAAALAQAETNGDDDLADDIRDEQEARDEWRSDQQAAYDDRWPSLDVPSYAS